VHFTTPTWLLLEALGLGEGGALRDAPRLLLLLLLLLHIRRQRARLLHTCEDTVEQVRPLQQKSRGAAKARGVAGIALTLRMGRATWGSGEARGPVLRQREACGSLALHRRRLGCARLWMGAHGGQRRRAVGMLAVLGSDQRADH
jgi:hypothetical protein